MQNYDKGHILVVDDDPDMLWVLQDLLVDDGFKVSIVNNGESAIKIVKENSVDLVILDVAMPSMNGIEALQIMKAISSEIKVIMITAFRDEDILQDVHDKGALECIYKPFDVKYVREKVGSVLHK